MPVWGFGCNDRFLEQLTRKSGIYDAGVYATKSKIINGVDFICRV